jgi:hypothetical protein
MWMLTIVLLNAQANHHHHPRAEKTLLADLTRQTTGWTLLS